MVPLENTGNGIGIVLVGVLSTAIEDPITLRRSQILPNCEVRSSSPRIRGRMVFQRACLCCMLFDAVVQFFMIYIVRVLDGDQSTHNQLCVAFPSFDTPFLYLALDFFAEKLEVPLSKLFERPQIHQGTPSICEVLIQHESNSSGLVGENN